jgi:hypothetical protein
MANINVKIDGVERNFQLRDITIEDFLRISVLKSLLSLGRYNDLVRMQTTESELHLDIIDAIAYINVFVEKADDLLKELGVKEKSFADLPAKKGAVVRRIGKAIEPFYKEIFEDYKEVLPTQANATE